MLLLNGRYLATKWFVVKRCMPEELTQRTKHGIGWDRNQDGGSSFEMILLNAGIEQIPALADSFEVTLGDDCGLFGVG